MKTRLLMVADDFTGALDSGVQLSKCGIDVTVYLDSDSVSFNNSEVVVVNTNSRHLTKEEAYHRVYAITMEAKQKNVEFFYKKTDSGLRGNIGCEIAAMYDALDENSIFFVPAYPKMKRTTSQGIQYVDGIELEKSIFREDPFNPITESFIPNIIATQSELAVTVTKPGLITDSMKGIIVVDAITDDDLENTSKMITIQNVKVMAGCAGFAEYLPKVMGYTKREITKKKNCEGFIVSTASINPKTISQIEYVKAKGFTIIKLLEELRTDRYFTKSKSFITIKEQLTSHISSGVSVVLTSIESLQDFINIPGVSVQEISKIIAENMGALTAEIIKNTKATVLIIGGDLLYAVFSYLGIQRVIPKNEIVTGVVEFEVVIDQNSRSILSKSGGFGSKECIFDIYNVYCKNNNINISGEINEPK